MGVTVANNMTEFASNEAPEDSDLLTLPVRACLAFAVRCALRVKPVLELLDEESVRAAHRAIGVAAEHAGGIGYGSEALLRLNDFHPELPYARHQETRLALQVVRWMILTAFAVNSADWFARSTLDNSTARTARAAAAAAAKAAIESQRRYLEGVWQDLNSLKAAVNRGEITARSPVPQSFFPAKID
jgi:hypothetical protein